MESPHVRFTAEQPLQQESWPDIVNFVEATIFASSEKYARCWSLMLVASLPLTMFPNCFFQRSPRLLERNCFLTTLSYMNEWTEKQAEPVKSCLFYDVHHVKLKTQILESSKSLSLHTSPSIAWGSSIKIKTTGNCYERIRFEDRFWRAEQKNRLLLLRQFQQLLPLCNLSRCDFHQRLRLYALLTHQKYFYSVTQIIAPGRALE